MQLTESVIKSFVTAKTVLENSLKVCSIDFFETGEILASSCNEDTITSHSCRNGNQMTTLSSKKYGVDLVRFTRDANAIIHSSTKVDDAVRHLSIQDNKYIRYFQGHTKKVTSLCMSPTDNTFLSGSLDNTIRIWDFRLSESHGVVKINGHPVAAFEPEGLIFAAGVNSEFINLYDLRSFSKGPFETFNFQKENDCDWTSLKLSPDGRFMLISTNGRITRLIDPCKGTSIHTFLDQENGGVPLEASFSPDSNFVFRGSTDGSVNCWNTKTGVKIDGLKEKQAGPVHCVQFNPKFMMLVSSSTNMTFWLPNVPDNKVS